MRDSDIKTGKDMLQEDYIKKNPTWVKELELMLKSKEKAEIRTFLKIRKGLGLKKEKIFFWSDDDIVEALSTFGFQYLTEDYLPRKLRQGDWI